MFSFLIRSLLTRHHAFWVSLGAVSLQRAVQICDGGSVRIRRLRRRPRQPGDSCLFPTDGWSQVGRQSPGFYGKQKTLFEGVYCIKKGDSYGPWYLLSVTIPDMQIYHFYCNPQKWFLLPVVPSQWRRFPARWSRASDAWRRVPSREYYVWHHKRRRGSYDTTLVFVLVFRYIKIQKQTNKQGIQKVNTV